jgi:1-acyl-sn-glycerol-3-phosphate acyltransferase
MRWVSVAFMFLLFGVGAVLLSWILIPLLMLARSRSAEPAGLLAQRWVQRAFAAFLWIGERLDVMEITYSGAERLRNSSNLIVANHPSLLDVVILLARIPQGDCVVKSAAWKNPALAGIVRAAHYIPGRDGEQVVAACSQRLREGRTVLLFPEGSRSPEVGLRPFQRGAAHIALRSGCAILPVLIRCDPPALKKEEPWYAFPKAKLRYSVIIGEPKHVPDLLDDGLAPPVAARRLTDELRSYFERGLCDGVT